LECGRNAPSESRATNQADCASTGGLPGVGGGGTVKCRRGSSRGDAVEGYWRFPADYITARNAHFLCPTDASPTKTRSGSCGLSKRLHPKAQCSSRLLSWGSFKDLPSTDITDAPTSPAEPKFNRRLEHCQHSRSVRPCRFSRLRRFSAHQLAGLLHPAASHGVRQVSDGCRSSCLPHWRPPFEAFPSSTAENTSPRLVPSRRCCAAR